MRRAPRPAACAARNGATPAKAAISSSQSRRPRRACLRCCNKAVLPAMTVDPADASLAWRIPRMEERLALRMAWVRWFLTLVVFSLAIVFVWPSETRLAAFTGGAPFLALLWWLLVYRRRQQMPREPNVWLDQNELRW